MFDEIFNRWITTGQLTENDIVPLFLEYDREFLGGKVTPQQVMDLISHVYIDYYSAMCRILKLIGVKRHKEWEELVDRDGRVIKRFFINNQSNS